MQQGVLPTPCGPHPPAGVARRRKTSPAPPGIQQKQQSTTQAEDNCKKQFGTSDTERDHQLVSTPQQLPSWLQVAAAKTGLDVLLAYRVWFWGCVQHQCDVGVTGKPEYSLAADLNVISSTPCGLQGHIDVVDSWLHSWRLPPTATMPNIMTFNPFPARPVLVAVCTLRGAQPQAAVMSTYIYLGVHFQ